MPQRSIDSSLSDWRGAVGRYHARMAEKPRHARPETVTPHLSSEPQFELPERWEQSAYGESGVRIPRHLSAKSSAVTLGLLLSTMLIADNVAKAGASISPAAGDRYWPEQAGLTSGEGPSAPLAATFPRALGSQRVKSDTAAAEQVTSPKSLRLTRSAAARSVEDIPQLNGDLPLEKGSFAGARVKAARKLWGERARGMEDEQVLHEANRIHLDARANPDDEAKVRKSYDLLREEAHIWALENGGDKVKLSREREIALYRKAWKEEHNLPKKPKFKPLSEITKEIVAQTPAHKRRRLPLSHVDMGGIVAIKASKLYYKQFIDYIEDNIDKLSISIVNENARRNKIPRLFMEFRPDEIYHIDKIVQMKGYSGISSLGIPKELTNGRNMPALIARLPDHGFVLVDPEGRVKRLDRNPADSGDFAELARKLDVKFTDYGGDPRLMASVRILLNSPNQRSIKEFAVEKTKEYLKSQITDLEQAPKAVEREALFKAVSDVVENAVAAGLMAVPILGESALAIRSGVKAAEAAVELLGEEAATEAKASAAARAVMDGSKTSTFLRESGQELSDFIVPDFFDADGAQAYEVAHAPEDFSLLKRCRRGNVCGVMSRGDNRALLEEENLQESAGDGEDILKQIYRSLLRTGRVRSPYTEQLIKEEIDERAKLKVPKTLYRVQAGRSIVIPEKFATMDDRLAAIIKHVATHVGRKSEAASLTMARQIAERFKTPTGKLLRIDTSHDPENFRTVEDILKNDGPRLAKSGKISKGTLAKAIETAFNEQEQEVFYVQGDIPDEWVEVIA